MSQVITDAVQREQVIQFLDQQFDELERIVQALAVLREVSPRWLDTIAAAGEIMSSRIVAAALTSHGLLATWIDARRAVVTDGEHTAAAPLFPETTAALMAHVDPPLAAGPHPGGRRLRRRHAAGVTTTLGRGGSDYSAAIVGACLGASEIQIWTDVDGMLTADPRIVADPHVVPHLSFAEASELAYFGAKVLHPATIQPAVARNIPVRILNSHRPQARGTLITGERPPSARPLTAIASKKHVSVVSITSTRMLMAHGFLRRLFEVFEKWKTAVDVITTSEVTVSVTVDDRRRLPAIVEALSEFAEVESEHDMAIVCVVGEGLQNDPRLIGEVLQSVGRRADRAGVAGGVAPQRDVRHPRGRSAARAEPAARPVLRAGAGAGGLVVVDATLLLLIGHGRMGKLVEALAPEYRRAVSRASSRRRTPSARFATAISAESMSRSTSRCRRGAANLPLLAERGINVVIGTTGWAAHERELRALVARSPDRRARRAELLARHEPVPTRSSRTRRAASPAIQAFGAWIHELHHAAKKDAPSGTALQLKAGMERAGYARADRRVLHARRVRFPGTHTVGFDGPSETVTLTHTVRDRAVFARGALEAARWLTGPPRLVHDAGHA